MSKQSQRIVSYSQLVRRHQTEDQKKKREVEYQFSNGRKFYRRRNPYQNAS